MGRVYARLRVRRRLHATTRACSRSRAQLLWLLWAHPEARRAALLASAGCRGRVPALAARVCRATRVDDDRHPLGAAAVHARLRADEPDALGDRLPVRHAGDRACATCPACPALLLLALALRARRSPASPRRPARGGCAVDRRGRARRGARRRRCRSERRSRARSARTCSARATSRRRGRRSRSASRAAPRRRGPPARPPPPRARDRGVRDRRREAARRRLPPARLPRGRGRSIERASAPRATSSSTAATVSPAGMPTPLDATLGGARTGCFCVGARRRALRPVQDPRGRRRRPPRSWREAAAAAGRAPAVRRAPARTTRSVRQAIAAPAARLPRGREAHATPGSTPLVVLVFDAQDQTASGA